jgi:C1A family cysteine protease
MKTGKVVQLNADQIYAKAKETDKQMNKGGTYPDLAMAKGLELMPKWKNLYAVKTSTSREIDELKRIIHGNMFACVNMVVTKDIYRLNDSNFVYGGNGDRAGGHSMVCCGYDEESKMLIMQNHWGTIWGLKGFFLCPYDVWARQSNLTCWYERLDAPSSRRKPRIEIDSSEAELG